ncbi:MAG TPA: type IV toxin-antitoxin system AbiEi family antitoxin domain-containing protein, partial [Puia sp.]
PQAKIVLFGGAKEKLPAWFTRHDWGATIEFHPTSFLDPHTGLENREVNGFKLAVSSPGRALMECLYLAPEHQDLMECYELMKGLKYLEPEEVQELLEKCRSVKVKRLFIYMADKAGHQWLEDIDPTNIDQGKGKRSIVKNGLYDNGSGISVPKELAEMATLPLDWPPDPWTRHAKPANSRSPA